MARRKTMNVVRITITMPSELSEWIAVQAEELSLDISSAVRVLLLGVKKQQEEASRNKRTE